MDGWMDGWMAGWMDGCGWMWMAGWMAGWMDGWMDGLMGEGFAGWGPRGAPGLFAGSVVRDPQVQTLRAGSRKLNEENEHGSGGFPDAFDCSRKARGSRSGAVPEFPQTRPAAFGRTWDEVRRLREALELQESVLERRWNCTNTVLEGSRTRWSYKNTVLEGSRRRWIDKKCSGGLQEALELQK